MAGMKSIDDARVLLEESCLQLTMLVSAFDDLAGDNDPPWLFLIRSRVKEIDDFAQAYMMEIHHHARPVLRDFEALSKKNAG